MSKLSIVGRYLTESYKYWRLVEQLLRWMDLPVPEFSTSEEIEPATPEDPEIEPAGGSRGGSREGDREPAAATPEEDPEEGTPECEEPHED